MNDPVEHLYVHLPFCVHRCGYCDFVTSVGRVEQHADYADALLAELGRERELLAPRPKTVYLGGGTPTFTEPAALARVLAELPAADEVTVEANPETVTPELAALLLIGGVTRVSLGAQSFQPHLLDVLERRTTPAQVREAFAMLRAAGFDNLSLDLIYGIPGQSEDDLAADLHAALELQPEHLSAYELEAKPGTRFTHAWAEELGRQAEALEGYAEAVVDRLVSGGMRWYETANFCRRVDRRDLRAQHNLAVWRGEDYLGVGVGAVSTLGALRRRNAPSVPRYLAALQAGDAPPRELEELDDATRAFERLMLGLRLDEELPLDGLEEVVDPDALTRMVARGMVERTTGGIRLATPARLLGGAVTAELLA